MGERPRILVLYATQTGNAQDVAERLGREAARRHFHPVVESMHLYDASELPRERLVLVVVSTTGQGDPPESMRAFWRALLRKSLGHRWLEATRFAVFGLGDSGYPKYNVTGKKLDRRLLDLGGKPVVERGLGDDQHPSGFEAALDPWLTSLWSALREHVPLPPGLEDPRPDETGITILDPPKYRVTFRDSGAPEIKLAEGLKMDIVERWVEHGRARAMVDSAGNPFGNAREHNSNSTGFGPPSMPVFAQLLTNTRITSEDHEQDVRHIELELGSSGARYAPGDILTLLPRQKQASIDKFLSRCGLDGDTFVTVEAADSEVCTITHEAGDVEFISRRTAVPLRTIVEALMDVDSASPRRYFFEVMSHFATAEHEKERLQYFATPEGRDDLYRYNQRERRTVLEVLEDFPSVQLPFEWLLQTVPRLQQRSFSISSSLSAHPNEAHLTVAVVEWTTPFKRKRRGLCSSWLASLDPKNGKVFLPVWFTKGAISLPSPSVPLILVGPGTGCAPFRAFIQERVALVSKGEDEVAPVLFFFGCRNKSKDFLYEADWAAWSEGHNVLSVEAGGDVFVAFSRDQPEKVYVQHKIIEQGKKVLQMLQAGAAIYVAGSANKMPADVLSAFESVIAKETGWPQDSVSKYLRDLERKGRYVVEAWS